MSEQNPTVMVVDDKDDTRFMLGRMLSINGHEVVEAANGEQAVKLAERGCPDLILMDLNMPLLDGLGAIERVRRLKGKCRKIPIIVMTAYDTYGMKEAALKAGCDEYLDKPLNLDELETMVNRYLGLK